MMTQTETKRVTNEAGHEVKVPGSVLAYHIERLMAAIELAAIEPFAETLAVEHATLAAHEVTR